MSTDAPNDETDTRPRGLLTEADRAFLRGEKEMSQGAKRNARQRIRDRLQAGMADFELLWNCMSNRDLELVFHPEDKVERNLIRVASHYALSFIWLGLWQNQDPHPNRIEDAIEQAAFVTGYAADVSLSMDYESLPDGELLLAKMAHKEQRMNELRERLRSDSLTSDVEAELTTELEREASFQYYLFEKALLDSAIDPEDLADITLIGEPLELTAEDIEKERAGWASSPVQRQSMPILTDVTIEPRSQRTADKERDE